MQMKRETPAPHFNETVKVFGNLYKYKYFKKSISEMSKYQLGQITIKIVLCVIVVPECPTFRVLETKLLSTDSQCSCFNN